jgi:hypothetical protein
MTRDEREALIDKLQAANAASIDELARRQAAREADPNSELERLMADARFTRDQSDLVYSEPVEPLASPSGEEPGDQGIIYKRYENRAALYDPAASGEPSGGDEVWGALDRFTGATAKALDDDDRRIAALERENAELRRRLDLKDERDRTVAERSARVSQLQAENTVARREAERAQLDKALDQYRTRVDRLERELGMLLRYIGGDLPRGWGRE